MIDNSNIQSRKTSPNNILTKFCTLCQSRTCTGTWGDVLSHEASGGWWGISQQVRRLWFNWGSSLPSTPLTIQLYHIKLNVLLTAFLAFPTLHYKQPSWRQFLMPIEVLKALPPSSHISLHYHQGIWGSKLTMHLREIRAKEIRGRRRRRGEHFYTWSNEEEYELVGYLL